jgi:hypothetical protein
MTRRFQQPTWCGLGPNKVPERLQQFSAEFLSNGKSGQVLRERTLDTKDLGEATIRAKPVLVKLEARRETG